MPRSDIFHNAIVGLHARFAIFRSRFAARRPAASFGRLGPTDHGGAKQNGPRIIATRFVDPVGLEPTTP